jgi:RNA polymerase sigma-70 factor (ECF subfamily)
MADAIGEAFPEVLAAAKVGAEWAITLLYRSLNPAVLRYLRARAGGEGEDLASQVWLEAARGLGGFDGGEDQFAGWVFTIAKRRLSNWRRDASRRPQAAGGEVGEVEAIDSRAEAALDAYEGDEAVRLIVAVLPDDQAEVILLRVVAGLSVEAVAELTGRKPGAVRVAQHRALNRLAEHLGGESPRTSDKPVTRRRRRGM